MNSQFRQLLAWALLTGSLCAQAQEFTPYASTGITEAQWTAYFDEVRAKHGASMKQLPQDLIVVFSDRTTATQYAFTQPGHPAHPAWITRQVSKASGELSIRQIGYFAGDEVAFTALFRAYQKLNEQAGDRTKQQGQRAPKK